MDADRPDGAAPRLLATDLDGTLLRPDGSVSPRTAAALRSAPAAGLDVVFVTARPHRWLAPIAPLVGPHGVAICANGASVAVVASRTLVEQHGMSAEVTAAVAGRLRAALGPSTRLAVESATGLARELGFESGHRVPSGSPQAARIEDVLTPVTLKLLVRTGEPDSFEHPDRFIAQIAAAIDGLASVSSSGADGLGEIAAPGVTKAGTLAGWAAGRGVEPAQVWAVGDAPNDLPMLTWAGRAFAVANAHPDVLAVADEVLPSNAADGVAALLERMVAARGTLRPG
jgi:hypothetical protein